LLAEANTAPCGRGSGLDVIAKTRDGIGDGFPELFHFFGGLVRLARPEETAKAVLFAAGYDVHVQMRHALADAVVDGHEGTVGRESSLDGASQQLGSGEERMDQCGGEIRKRFGVLFGNEQGVAWEDGPVVQERKRRIIFEDDGRGHGSGNNPAEDAARGRISHGR